LAFVASILVFFSPGVLACTCLTPPFHEELARSSTVFAGKVVEVQEIISEAGEGDGLPAGWWLQATFSVSRVWKGPEKSSLVAVTPYESASCGYPFKEGQSYLVYARGSGDTLSVNSCSRTKVLESAGADLILLNYGLFILLGIVLVIALAAIAILRGHYSRKAR
jgi:hypothetical protein